MLVNEKALKDFKKRLKERQNELERSVGEILSQFVGEIRDFGFELYSQHTIEFDHGKTIFDYALRLKHGDAEDWVELYEYAPDTRRILRNVSAAPNLRWPRLRVLVAPESEDGRVRW